MKLTIHAVLAGLAILGAAFAAEALTSRTLMADRAKEVQYAAIVPEKFGDWTLVPSIRLVTPVDADDLANIIYSQMVGRAYVNKSGQVVMLLLAYGPRQNDKLQLHRPEACYVADGFRVTGSQPGSIAFEDGRGAINVRKLVAQREGRNERITYWMRVGDDIVSTLFERQLTKIRYGLRRVIPDGLLVRVSTVNLDVATADRLHAQFLSDMIKSVAAHDLPYLVGDQNIPGNKVATAPSVASGGRQ